MWQSIVALLLLPCPAAVPAAAAGPPLLCCCSPLCAAPLCSPLLAAEFITHDGGFRSDVRQKGTTMRQKQDRCCSASHARPPSAWIAHRVSPLCSLCVARSSSPLLLLHPVVV